MAALVAQMAASAELDSAYERLQRVDSVIAKAFADVPVPEGLGDRILANLAAARPASTENRQARPEGEQPAVQAAVQIRRAASSRRRLLGWSLAVALSVAVLVPVAIMLMRPHATETYTLAQAQDEAIGDFQSSARGSGELVDLAPPPEKYLFSPNVHVLPQMRWRWVNNLLGQRGIAYDINTPWGVAATLYVMEASVADLPADFPPSTPFTTAQWSIAAWQTEGLVYVLVVRGSERDYQRLLDLPSGPVT